MIDLSFRDDSAEGVLTLDGEMTIQQAGELREALLNALSNADKVYLKVEKISAADLSFLQLMCSAHRTAAGMKKQLTWASGMSDVVSRMASVSGYARHAGCVRDTNKSCIWVSK